MWTGLPLKIWLIFLVRDESMVSASQRRLIGDMLSEARNERRLQQLLEAKDQGRAFHINQQVYTDSNHWIAAGAFTSFAEYRFAIKARLNLLPTKSVVQRSVKQIDTTCARCKSQPETLAHVLNTCTPNTGMMRERHNLILHRLAKAIPRHIDDCFLEQQIPGSPGDLQPDIYITNKDSGEAIIVDVTTLFETGTEAFDKARSENIDKYTHLVDC